MRILENLGCMHIRNHNFPHNQFQVQGYQNYNNLYSLPITHKPSIKSLSKRLNFINGTFADLFIQQKNYKLPHMRLAGYEI